MQKLSIQNLTKQWMCSMIENSKMKNLWDQINEIVGLKQVLLAFSM